MARYIIFDTVKYGQRGNQVKAVQEALPSWSSKEKIDVDGIFGSSTEKAVTNFQKSCGLPADGIVGESTGKALNIWSDVEIGFDISHWNKVEWSKVPISSIKFVNVKATEGVTYIDESFKESVISANQIGLATGAYHFTKFSNNPYDEAANFLNACYNMPLQRLYLDLEWRQTDLNSEQIYLWVIEFLKTVKGVYPAEEIGIYTSDRFLSEKSLQKYTDLNQYSLWAADWNEQPYVYPWKHWTTWQYTSTASVTWASGEIDMDYRVKEI